MNRRNLATRLAAALVMMLVTTLLATFLIVANTAQADSGQATPAANPSRIAAPFAPRVHAMADLIVTGHIASTEVVTGVDDNLWTLATLDVSDVESGTPQERLVIATPGGTDPTTGRWAISSHSAALVDQDRVRLALIEAPESLQGELPGSDEVYLVAMGNEGAQVIERTAERFAISQQLIMWDFSQAVAFRTNPNINSQLHPSATAIVQRSFQAMEDDPGSAIDWNYAGTTGATSGTSIFDTSGPFDNHVTAGTASGLLGYAQIVGNAQGATGFRIVIEPNVTVTNSLGQQIPLAWRDGVGPGSANALNLQAAIMHELGHVVGLDHPVEDGNVMAVPQLVSSDPSVYSGDDRAGLAFLYPTPGSANGTCDNPGPGAIVGTQGNDALTGTAGNDLIIGLGGNDTIGGAGGNDTICGGPGDDTIFGQAGNDLLFGGSGNDKIRGGDGNDLLYGEDGSDDLNGGRGDDVVAGGTGADSLVRGGTGDDIVDGGPGNDTLINGNGGEDVVDGGSGSDGAILGGPRPDLLRGGAGNDRLRGLGGADQLFGFSGNDELLGGAQPDRILNGGNEINGAPGNDTCNGGADLTASGAVGLCEVVSNFTP